MDLDRLEQVAREALPIHRALLGLEDDNSDGLPLRRHYQQVDPPTVLALIDRVRRAERVVVAARTVRVELGDPGATVAEERLWEALDAYDREEDGR